MKNIACMALASCLVAGAQAQDSGLTVSAGARLWSAQWTTFGYADKAGGGEVITQVPADDKVVIVPLLSLRWREWVASFSGYQSTSYRGVDGSNNLRKEFDANVGYLVAPGVAVTLGYKKLVQRGEYRYEPAGLVLGVSASAPLGGAFAMYGALGIGRLKTPSSDDKKVVQFDSDYRLTEAGLAYTLTTERWPKALVFTVGYRMQVLNSKEAAEGQDGRDLTHGFTFGLIATF